MNNPLVRGAIVLVTIICVTVLAALGHITETAYVALTTLMLGYVFGKASDSAGAIKKLGAAMNPPATKPLKVPDEPPPIAI